MEVLNVYVTTKKFIVSIYEGVVEIKRSDFEEWADEEQKREWMEVTADHRGEAVENEGTLPWREYFKSKTFWHDVGQYIDLKHLKPLK